jgi:ATP-dependent Clp protease ATP-binding subunit ClpB
MALEISESAKALIAEKGYDPVYGARPLKRTIQRMIQDPLAVKILGGEFAEGDLVKIEADGDELVFSRSTTASPEQSYESRTIH